MSVYQIPIGQSLKDLSEYRDRYLLVVNIANRCGFHYQFEDLIQLHRSGKCQVIAFPSNQFYQHQGDVCRTDIPFPIEVEVCVNGEKTHPLFQYLKHKAKGLFGQERILWNYTKFLIAPKERFIHRFSPISEAAKVEDYINVP